MYTGKYIKKKSGTPFYTGNTIEKVVRQAGMRLYIGPSYRYVFVRNAIIVDEVKEPPRKLSWAEGLV